ncbi:MAG: DUF11 domain-containing protein, partial [bacterium]
TSRVIYDTVSHSDITGESAPNYGYAWSTEKDETKVTGHSVTITGLDPFTMYYFRPLSSASPEIYGTEISVSTIEGVGGNGGDDTIVLGEESAPLLAINKTVNIDFANPGDNVDYKVVVTNNGNLTAFNTILYDGLPEGLTYFSYNGESNTEQEWIIGDLEPGMSKTIDYVVLVSKDIADGIYLNTAEVKADNHDPIAAVLGLEIRKPEVLAVTGFDRNELIYLLIGFAAIMSASLILRQKFSINKC